MDGPVIENGAVEVRDGVITAVGTARELNTTGAVDLGDAAVLPGFVNAHTHLELGYLAGKVQPQGDLIDWLGRLLAVLQTDDRTEELAEASVKQGLEMSASAGVVAVGDISRFPELTRPLLSNSGLHTVSFGEVTAVGNRRHLLDERLAAASCRDQETLCMCVGISPHAPYSVEPDAMRACGATAREMNARMCIHLCESADEETFTRYGGGRLTDHLRAIGVWDDNIPVAGVGPVELALLTGVLGPRTIIAHGNYVSDEDIQRIASSGASVAYCPRTHAAFGHPPHRFRDMLAAGINVCVGTDSLACNPDLSVLEELRFLRRICPHFSSDELLAMGTIRGAQALGMDGSIGSIAPGKCADLVVVPLESTAAGCWDSLLREKASGFVFRPPFEGRVGDG